jgi:hypothetical protein
LRTIPEAYADGGTRLRGGNWWQGSLDPCREGVKAVKYAMNEGLLRSENADGLATAYCNAENASLGFVPAFLDFETQLIYPSRFADGRLAPFHLLDGLPDDVVTDRLPCGRITSAKATLIAGFLRKGFFYTRSAAARMAG